MLSIPSQAAKDAMEGSTTKYLPMDDGDETQEKSDALPPSAAPLQEGAVPLPPSLPLRNESSGHETDTEDSDSDTVARRDPNYVPLQHHEEPIAGASAVKPKRKSKFKLFKGKKESDDVTYVEVSDPKPKHHRSAPVQQGDIQI